MPHSDGCRPGLARDQTIFITVCSIAILVAVLALASFVRSGSSTPFVGDWQCLECGRTFASKTLMPGPIDCPTCSGQAVKLIYVNCPQCGRRVLTCQMRLTEPAQREFDSYQAAHSEELAAGRFPKIVFRLPMQARYRIRQPDDSYRWDEEWLYTESERAQELRSEIKCSHRGTQLYPIRN